jgi:cytidylate kinase
MGFCMGIITVARQVGSEGETVAGRVAKGLGFAAVDRELLEGLVQAHGLTGRELDESDEERGETGTAVASGVHVDYLQAVLLELAGQQDIVVVGRGGQFLFRECPWSLHVRVVASPGFRRAALQRIQDVHDAEIDGMLEEADRRRADWIRHHYGGDWEDPTHYDLIVRTDRLGSEGAATVIQEAADLRGIAGHIPEIAAWIEQGGVERLGGRSGGAPGFVHPSEAELARVLDFYRIRWQYEPTSFPLEWDEAGNVTEAFTPDFYLTDLDLYLELTTLKQSLVTDKNRKIRKFRELYPDTRLKVFYGRDFRSLVQKYGLPPTAPGPAPFRAGEVRAP